MSRTAKEVALLTAVDEFLSDIRSQSMVDQSRVVDFALDLRLIVEGKEVADEPTEEVSREGRVLTL